MSPGAEGAGWLALTREISAGFADCALTHLARVPIDLERARREHADYCAALAAVGCRVERLAAPGDLPDAVFVEDCAVVTPEIAVITRPGLAARRPETAAIEAALGHHRPTVRMQAPARLDGGDVLRQGRRIFVGRTARTDDGGIAALRELLAPFDYEVVAVAVVGALHLKTAVCPLPGGAILVNPAWVDPAVFGAAARVEVDPGEPFAGNALTIADRVIYPDAYPATARRLRAAGFDLVTVGVSEIAKAEGGVTCCSLIVESPAGPGAAA